MSGYIPPAQGLLPSAPFEMLIARIGQRVSWMRGHTCPCVFGGAGANGHLPTPGSAEPGCLQCLGVGTYWDNPSLPFTAFLSYSHMSPTPDEPGVRTDPVYGVFSSSEPSMTLPFVNPLLGLGDPQQPSTAWAEASVNDMFVPVDMLARYTAVLQSGGVTNLPYQQNVQVAASGAVATWNPITKALTPVSGYTVSGATVTLPPGYAAGTNYMVEFQAAPLYVAYRPAGGLPHIRPFGGGTINEPRRFRLQALDFYTRQRALQPQVPGVSVAPGLSPFAAMRGQPVPYRT